MGITLQKGDSAPVFTRKDVFGSSVKLADFSGGYTLLAFLRYADCPWCNLAIHRLSVEYPLLRDSRCDVIAFIQSPEDVIIDTIHNVHAVAPPFPVIADPNMDTYKLYGVKSSIGRGLKHHIINAPRWVQSVAKGGLRNQKIDSNFFLAPAIFLIAPNGRIVMQSYTADLYDHATFTAIYNAIAEYTVHGE